MKKYLPWLGAMFLPATLGFAQQPSVRVIFAPEYNRAPLAATMAAAKNSAEFTAPGKMVGTRVGWDSATVSTVSIGADGKARFFCEPLSASSARLRKSSPAPVVQQEVGVDK